MKLLVASELAGQNLWSIPSVCCIHYGYCHEGEEQEEEEEHDL